MTKLSNQTRIRLWRRMSLFHLIAFFLFSAFLVTSCKKTPSQLGADLLPDSTLQVIFTDTASIEAYSKPIDTTRADELLNSYIGSIQDPVFGQTQSSLYTKIITSTVGHRFGTNPKLDSLVLQLNYAGVYGDTNTTLRIHVYELAQDLFYDSVYFSNQTLETMGTDYADFAFQPRPNNQVIIGSDTVHKVVRIRLSDYSTELGNKLLHADTTVLDSNELFMDYFKGLYLTTDVKTNGGALPYFTTNSSTTVLTVYYSNDDNDSLRYAFTITSAMARISHYQHDYSTASQTFIKQVVDGDTTLGKEQFYVQGLAGVKTLIRFPQIKQFARTGKIGVNEAKLVLPGIETSPYLGAPAKLSLIKIVSDSSYATLADENEGADYFGGTYDSVSKAYEFRITQYIQSLIQDTTQVNRGLLLFVNNGSIQPQRFIFGGTDPANDTAVRTRLKLVYTRMD
jgi:hypothetical protein